MTADRRRIWSPLPTPTQARLVHLVLAPTLDPVELEAWSRAVDLKALDEGSQRLLPSLYLRLKAAGVDHPWLSLMQAQHRRWYFRNRLLIRRGLAVVRKLAREGIPCLLLKGAALAPRYYADLGERPMGDFDILVPEATPPAAVQALLTADGGLRLRERALHAHAYRDRGGFECDIHWHLMPELSYGGSGAPLWERAEPMELEGESCRTLSPEDHVYHLLAHGLRVSDVPPLRWIVDTATVLLATPQFDWSRLLDQVVRSATIYPVAAGLSVLVDKGLTGSEGGKALATLEASAQRRVDRYLFAGQMRRPVRR